MVGRQQAKDRGDCNCPVRQSRRFLAFGQCLLKTAFVFVFLLDFSKTTAIFIMFFKSLYLDSVDVSVLIGSAVC